MKTIVSLLCLVLSISFSIQANALRLYTPEKYEAARERAVQEAKAGDLTGALKSLSRLLKLEPDNKGALYDYITILVWNEENKNALKQIEKLNLSRAPEYVLRSLIAAARKEKEIETLDQLIKTYMKRYSFVPEDTPAMISGKSMHEIAEIASESHDLYLISLSILKQLHLNAPDDQAILADYIVILTKTGNYEQALTAMDNLDLDKSGDEAIGALINSAYRMRKTQLATKLKTSYLNKQKAEDDLRPAYNQKSEDVINKAVQEARNDNFSGALNLLSDLLQLEPNNHRALYDYITISVWNNENKTALEQINKVELSNAPEYVLRSLGRAANIEKNEFIVDQVVNAYMQRFSSIPSTAPELIRGKDMHETALIIASKDMYLLSHSILKNLLNAHPNDQKLLADYIVILAKMNKYEQAIEFMPKLNLDEANLDVIAALITCASHLNNTKLLDQLNSFYYKKTETKDTITPIAELVKKPPSNTVNPDTNKVWEIQTPAQIEGDNSTIVEKHTHVIAKPKISVETQLIKQASTLITENKLEKAYGLLLPLYLEGNKSEEFLIVMARLFSRMGEHAKSANMFKQLVELSPSNDIYRKELILQLSYAGATNLALSELSAKPSLIAQQFTQSMTLDREVKKLRWSQYTLPEDVDKNNYLEDTTTAIHKHLAELDKSHDKNTLTRVSSDYLMALYLNNKMKKVTAEYERFQSEDIEVTNYALSAVADAYLSEHQPDTAIEMYLNLLKHTPENFELRKSLFYAYSDAGKYDLALKLAQDIAEQTPLWRKDHSGDIVKNNAEKLDSDILLINAYAFQDNLTEAHIRLEQLHEQAPYNAEIRANLSTIYRWRGWPEKAFKEAAIARTINPEDQYITITNVRALMDLHDYENADTLINDLNTNPVASNSLKELNKDWTEHNNREFYSRFELGDSTPKSSNTNNSNFGSSDLSLESFLYDKTFKHFYRPFIHQYYTEADFIEGKGRYERIGIGLEYKKKKNKLQTELSQSYVGQSEVGISVKGQHTINDFLKLNYGFDSLSTKVPVRANFHDITGKDYELGLTYRLHELTAISGGIEYLDFDDGNERKTGTISISHRLLNYPDYKMTVRPSIYYASNSTSTGPYYSPDRVSEINLSFDNEWLTYKRHNLTFKQRLEVNFGHNNQKNYSKHSTNAIAYQHEWAIEKSLYINYGIKYAKNYYDGDREDRKSFFASVNW